jgi:two-component sensor histidine kinase/CHASE3 domain sensor protein
VDEDTVKRAPRRPPAAPRALARWSTLAVFGINAAALLGSVVLIFGTIESERRQREQARDTAEILAELANINRAVLNAETGQRGYLITLDRRYLGPYLAARDLYPPAVARLRALVGSDDSRQAELLDRIENLADSKFAEMRETVGLLDNGAVLDARRQVLTDEGQEVMERLRAAIRELEGIEQSSLHAAASESARAEARVLPLLGSLLALLLVALVFGFRLAARTARAEAEAAQASALAEARDRADLLARELNHRVKNLFAVILAIVRMSGKDTPAAKPVVERIADRIHALLIAHEVTQGTAGKPVASLAKLVETTLAPYRSERLRAEVNGPEVLLPARQVTPLGLVLHELTTNAVKYGCWSEGGVLHVTWATSGGEVAIDWREEGGPSGQPPAGQGFGSLLMTSAARQLRGTIDREFPPSGARVAIRIPLDPNASG